MSNCRQGHNLDAPGVARTGVRGDGSRYRYCRLCEQSRRKAQHAPKGGGAAMSFAEIGHVLGLKTTDVLKIYHTAMAKLHAAVRNNPEQAARIRGLLALAATPNALVPAGACRGGAGVIIHGEYSHEGIVPEEGGENGNTYHEQLREV